jgi:very-short-patch-repair endonuclease
MSDSAKTNLINKMYTEQNLSFRDIAIKYNTYPNKILRDAKRLGIKIKNKSEAQKNALETGKHKHPTKGRQRTEEEKNNIGMAVMKNWESLDENELKKKKQIYQDLWNKKSDDDKANMLHKANLAVRRSSKVGSKLEHFVLNFLVEHGFKTEFHKEHILANTKLQIDILIPTMNIAIEIDGPSHFAPVWGEETLEKNITYDKKKTGLLIGKGFKLIRIKQTKDYSKARATLICAKLLDSIELLKHNQTNIIEIGDTDA